MTLERAAELLQRAVHDADEVIVPQALLLDDRVQGLLVRRRVLLLHLKKHGGRVSMARTPLNTQKIVKNA